MSKQGMKRPENITPEAHNEAASVPLIQGRAKHGKTRANPIIAGTKAPAQKVWHTTPYEIEKPVSSVYPVIDNDLARDNIENDMTAADLQDL